MPGLSRRFPGDSQASGPRDCAGAAHAILSLDFTVLRGFILSGKSRLGEWAGTLYSKPTMSKPSSNRPPWVHVAVAVVALLVFFSAVYYPYTPEQWPARCLEDYCALLARWTGAALRLIGEELQVRGSTIYGRFNLKVILSCGALDVWAMLSAAILATPQSWRTKLGGIVGGTVAILAANVVRLAALFLIGAKDIEQFHLFHEDIFSFVFVGYTLALYWLWLRITTRGIPAPKAALKAAPKEAS